MRLLSLFVAVVVLASTVAATQSRFKEKTCFQCPTKVFSGGLMANCLCTYDVPCPPGIEDEQAQLVSVQPDQVSVRYRVTSELIDNTQSFFSLGVVQEALDSDPDMPLGKTELDNPVIANCSVCELKFYYGLGITLVTCTTNGGPECFGRVARGNPFPIRPPVGETVVEDIGIQYLYYSQEDDFDIYLGKAYFIY